MIKTIARMVSVVLFIMVCTWFVALPNGGSPIIDLKPGSCPNCINPDSHGVVAVAILDTSYNPCPGTISFGGAPQVGPCKVEDADGDSRLAGV